MGAVQFIENMDRTTLTITDDEFEKNVEAAVSAIAEKHRPQSPATAEAGPSQTFSEKNHGVLHPSQAGGPSTRRSLEEPSTPRRSTSSNEGPPDTPNEDQAAIAGLLRTIQKPLSTIGRIFSDEPVAAAPVSSSPPPSLIPHSAPRTPAPPPITDPSPRPSGDHQRRAAAGEQPPSPPPRPPPRSQLSAEEAAARQASAEVAEAQRLHRAEHSNIVETLAGMFPDLDREIISDVVYQKQGR